MRSALFSRHTCTPGPRKTASTSLPEKGVASGRGGQPAFPPTAAGSVLTPSRVATFSPDHPFFMFYILLLTDNQDAEEVPSLEREQPSPVPPNAAYDPLWKVFSNFIKGNNCPIYCKKYWEDVLEFEVPLSCCDWAVGSGGTSQSLYCRPVTTRSLSKAFSYYWLYCVQGRKKSSKSRDIS